MGYYIIENKEKKGPLSISDLAQIGISKSTLVWKKGLDDWVSAEKLEELNDIINSTPPPIPTSEKQFEKERNINLNIGFKKRNQSEVNSHNRKKVIEKANFGLAQEIKSNLKLFPLSLLLFIPLFILIQFVFSSRRGEREYYNGRWNTYEFSDYWESNWVNDLDEIIPRILITFTFIVIFRYLLLLIKQLYRWFQHYTKTRTMKKVELKNIKKEGVEYFLLSEREINLEEASELAYKLTGDETTTMVDTGGISATKGLWILKRGINNEYLGMMKVESIDDIKLIE